MADGSAEQLGSAWLTGDSANPAPKSELSARMLAAQRRKPETFALPALFVQVLYAAQPSSEL